jgi:hypothetical protein
MSRKIDRQYNPMCATIDFHLKHCTRHRDVLTDASRNARSRPMTTIATPALSASVKRNSEKLPDPWLFDSEKLLREIDRCREMVLLIPAPTHETHFAVNIAVSAIWNLREDLRYLLTLHREGQRAFAKRHVDFRTDCESRAPKPKKDQQQQRPALAAKLRAR